jgi:RNA polymerase sigma factor (sigma-70 family)
MPVHAGMAVAVATPQMLPLQNLDRESGISSRAARNRLICSAIPMVHAIAHQVLRTQASMLVTHEELVSCGLLEVVRAADAFDAERGTRFSTFAYRWIRGAMIDAIRQALDYHRVIQFQPDCGVQIPVEAEEPGIAILDRPRVRLAMGALTLRQRQIMELLYDDPDTSFEAVAKVLGVKRPTVFRTNARAIRSLRSLLSKGRGAPPVVHRHSSGQV